MSLDKKNKIADFLSRYSNGVGVIEDFNVLETFISSRSLRTVESGVKVQDPLVIKLAEAGEADPKYVQLISHISGDTRRLHK